MAKTAKELVAHLQDHPEDAADVLAEEQARSRPRATVVAAAEKAGASVQSPVPGRGQNRPPER